MLAKERPQFVIDDQNVEVIMCRSKRYGVWKPFVNREFSRQYHHNSFIFGLVLIVLEEVHFHYFLHSTISLAALMPENDRIILSREVTKKSSLHARWHYVFFQSLARVR